MNLRDLPLDGKYIYFVGIGGISMSALAMILHTKGYSVCGYDRTPSALTAALAEKGVRIFYETDPVNLSGVGAAIYSAAFKPDHQEMKNITARGIPLYRRAELLGAIAADYPDSVGIAGTHGKSSTSGMLSYILMASEKHDPTVLVGAVLPAIGSTFRLGNDNSFVFEADEYSDSFLHFYPRIAALLNVRFDHTDYFENLDRMKRSFRQYLGNTGKDGTAVLNFDCADTMDCGSDYPGTVVTFSTLGNRNADYTAENIVFENGIPSYDFCHKGEVLTRITLSVPGMHNLANALAASVCAKLLGAENEAVKQGLKNFTGVKRRFEYKGLFQGAKVYDDYAHHPDEVKATLAAAKSMDAGRVIAIFQPHTFSRLRDLFDDFADSFNDCDVPILADVYSAREVDDGGVNSKLLADRVPGGVYGGDFDSIRSILTEKTQPGDLILFMGAGNITDLASSICP